MGGGTVFAMWVVSGLAGCLGLASEFRKKGGVIDYSSTDIVVMMVLTMFGPVSLAAYMLIKLEV